MARIEPPHRDGERPEIIGLVVPVPEAQAFAIHPHVTLIAPFGSHARVADAVLRDDLRAYFTNVAPFDFALVEVRTFPDGIVYLAPEPAIRFREITNGLATRYPDYPPYEGQFPDVIPHLTLDDGARPAPLPIRARASVADLVHSHGASWDIVDRFELAG